MPVKKSLITMILLVVAIFAVAINMRPAITSIGPMLDVIREQLMLTNAQVSLLTALPVICMGLFASLAPALNRFFGLRTTMYILLLTVGLFTAVRGIYASYTVLIISSIFIGIAIAIMGPLLSSMIKQNFPDRAASVIGIYSFGMGVGATMSTGLTALLFEKSGSYPLALASWSLLAIVGIIFWAIAMQNQLEVKQSGKTTIFGPRSTTKSPWKVKRAWVFLLFFGLQASAFFSIITWLVPIATSKGMTLLQAGTLVSVMTIIQIALNILFPLLMERFQARRFWLFLLLSIGLVAIILLWTGSSPLMWIGAVLMGIPLGGLFPAALVLPLDETDTPEQTNAWTAMMQTGGFIIGGLLPLLIAVLYDWTGNHDFTFLIFALLFLGMLGLTFIIGDKNGNRV
ncbi:MFS transporter [Sporosarcina oncorhynchi]|uniref:MFS transporter n=1 Tax=Sporosarcina oncorhynchi TaxID=3056444 RepID=A0ABZ0L902_9BACL|nr:MFS transporter [Sporosarcina sp. T2O-4]WOV89003.1 MFS transporter [Sporosarcina sp. T2O-4]